MQDLTEHLSNMGKNIFLTSDTHFSHGNIIKYCGRPFASIAEMNGYIMYRWNDVVGHDDVVIHLGDFSFGSFECESRTASALNGYKILLLGNHDKTVARTLRMGFDEAHKGMLKYKEAFMCHYGYVDTDKLMNSARLEKEDIGILKSNIPRVNVGVDYNDFAPLLLPDNIDEPVLYHGHTH